MIELHIILRAPPNQTHSMTTALQALAKNARNLQGCLKVEVCKNLAQPRYLSYVEIWESEPELRQMIASHHFSQLAALMELASESPSCEFRFISQTYGLSFAEQVRAYDNP